MKIRMIDEGKLSSNICDITFDIKFGKKRKGWIKIKFVPVLFSENSCHSCIFQKICHNSPLCAKIITEIVSTGHILFTPRHYKLCRI